jgi:hypothetical protein
MLFKSKQETTTRRGREGRRTIPGPSVRLSATPIALNIQKRQRQRIRDMARHDAGRYDCFLSITAKSGGRIDTTDRDVLPLDRSLPSSGRNGRCINITSETAVIGG